MKIKKISLTNFRSLKRVNCTLGNVNFIFGRNNEGKSSLIYGMEYALSNKSAISGDLATLQRKDTDECSVSIDVEQIGNITRYKKTSNQMNRLNDESVPDKTISKQLSETFGLDYETIGMMFDASRFTKKTKKDQKAFLLKLTGIELDAEKVISYLENPSEEAKNKVRKEVKNVQISIDEIADIYKNFYTERKLANKVYSDLESEIKALKANCIKDKPRELQYIKADIQKIANALKEIEKTLTIYNERVKQKETLEKTIKTGEENYEVGKSRLNEKVPRTQEYIDKMELQNSENLKKKSKNDKDVGIFTATLNSSKNNYARLINNSRVSIDDIVNDESIELLTNIDGIDDENNELIIKKNNNIKEIGILQTKIQNDKLTLTKLQTTKCPLSDAIECNYDKSDMISQLEKNIETWSKSIEKMEKENKEIDETVISNIKKIIKFCKTKLDLINKENKEINDSLELNAKKKKAIEGQIKIVEWLESSKKELDIRRKELSSIEIPKIDGLLEKKQELETSKENFEKEQKMAEKYADEQRIINKKEKELESKKEEVELLKYLVDEFAPNGVRSRILKKIIAPIVSIANERLEILTNGYSLDFDFDEDFDIYVTTKTGKLPFEQLSISEQLRLQIIIQDTINQLTNVGLMVIEEAGLLDDENFIQLLDLIKEIAPTYDNIFIVATKEKEDVVKISESIYSVSDDVQVFFIENNEVFKM